MTILENAIAHYKSAGSELKNVAVPEWGEDGKPALIYYKPVMSLMEKGQVLKAYQGENPAEAIAEILILRARDQTGKRLFAKAQKATILREVDEDVVARIVNEMQGESEDLSLEDAEKNL